MKAIKLINLCGGAFNLTLGFLISDPLAMGVGAFGLMCGILQHYDEKPKK